MDTTGYGSIFFVHTFFLPFCWNFDKHKPIEYQIIFNREYLTALEHNDINMSEVAHLWHVKWWGFIWANVLAPIKKSIHPKFHLKIKNKEIENFVWSNSLFGLWLIFKNKRTSYSLYIGLKNLKFLKSLHSMESILHFIHAF